MKILITAREDFVENKASKILNATSKFVPHCGSLCITKTYLSRRVNDAYSDYSLTVNCFVAPYCSKLKF